MSIWKKTFTLKEAAEMAAHTLVAHLDIRVTEIGDDWLVATMPVDDRTRQPYGLLHGGVSVALAETVGSMASHMAVPEGYYCVGLEINANHVKSARSGMVTGTARPIHLGGKTHIWGIDIRNENGDLICISRLTMAVLKMP